MNNIAKAKGKTTIHATVTRANGDKEDVRYLSGGGFRGSLTRFMRRMKGAING